MRPSRRARFPACLLAAALCAALPAAAQAPPAGEPSPEQRARVVRGLLQDARALLRQERADAAERTARRALALAPDDARLHRVLARALAEQGQADAAAAHRARANELDPPPAPLPQEPWPESARGIVVVLVPPDTAAGDRERVPGDWPDGVAARTLAERVRLRLPDASVELFAPADVASARAWLAERAPRGVLSLRVERAYCADTLKDGAFAVAQLRVAAEAPYAVRAAPDQDRLVLPNPRGSEGCEAEVVARAFERVLRHAAVRKTLAAPAPGRAARSGSEAAWQTAAIRSLFPGLGERIKAELDQGRTQLASGRIAAAAETFRRAARIDPEDAVVQTYLVEAEATLAMAAEIPARRGAPDIAAEDRGVLDPRFSPAQRAAAEARLAEERRLRAQLLAAHEVLSGGTRAPERETLAALRSARVGSTRAFGPRTARELVRGEVWVREAVGPDGVAIARYYIARSGEGPVLREEDGDDDGRADRWIAYRDGTRRDLWEDGDGDGAPELHFEYAADGESVARIEFDTDSDGRIDRIIEYAAGVLARELRDTDGDGVVDRFDRFDDRGFVATRDEDLDGDGEIDIRTTYRAGRLIERSLWETPPE